MKRRKVRCIAGVRPVYALCTAVTAKIPVIAGFLAPTRRAVTARNARSRCATSLTLVAALASPAAADPFEQFGGRRRRLCQRLGQGGECGGAAGEDAKDGAAIENAGHDRSLHERLCRERISTIVAELPMNAPFSRRAR